MTLLKGKRKRKEREETPLCENSKVKWTLTLNIEHFSEDVLAGIFLATIRTTSGAKVKAHYEPCLSFAVTAACAVKSLFCENGPVRVP